MSSVTTWDSSANSPMKAPQGHGPLQPSSSSSLNVSANCTSGKDEPVAIRLTYAEHRALVEMARRYSMLQLRESVVFKSADSESANLRSNLIALGADIDLIEKYSREILVLPSYAAAEYKVTNTHEVTKACHENTVVDSPKKQDDKTAVAKTASPRKPISTNRKPMSVKADVFYPSVQQTRVSTLSDKSGDKCDDTGHQTDSLDSDGPPVSQTPSNAGLENGEVPRNTIVRDAKRSLRLDNLTVTTSVSDIAESIRGGQVLEIHQRYKDKSAIVSFVYEHDARAFYEYYRKNDLYIKSKRVDVSWSDFQKPIHGQLAWSIRNGATRNLVVRHCDPYQTPDGIRDDLEHIDDLRVISVEFRGRNCHIKTNSISGAVFARTCMTSRRRYRRCPMEWDTDECTEPFTDKPKKVRFTFPSPPQRDAKPVNRYEMLSVDKESDSSDTLLRTRT